MILLELARLIVCSPTMLRRRDPLIIRELQRAALCDRYRQPTTRVWHLWLWDGDGLSGLFSSLPYRRTFIPDAPSDAHTDSTGWTMVDTMDFRPVRY